MNNVKKLLVAWMILLIITFSSGCNTQKDLGDRYVEGKDAQYMFMKSDEGRYIIRNNDGYYFVNGDYLYYSDKKNMKPVILCNKPNCLHDKESDPYKKVNCNAFIGRDASKTLLTIYDNNIYYYSRSIKKDMMPEIIRLSLDGTKRKSICKIDGLITSMSLHRGKLYYSTIEKTIENGEDDSGQGKAKLIEYDFLNSSAKPKVLKEYESIDGGIQGIVPFGNRIYFTEFGYQKENDKFKSDVEIYNLKDKTFVRLGDDVKRFGISNNDFFKNGNVYTPVIENGNVSKRDPHIYMCNLEGKNSKILIKDEIKETYFTDKNYIYLDNATLISDNKDKNIKRQIKVLNDKGQNIDTINVSNINSMYSFNGGDDDYMFVNYEDNEKSYIKYIDKKEIGTGKVKLKDFFEIDKKYMNSDVKYKK